MQIVVEHYRANVRPLLDGRAKAMVVVGSRLEAVRWQLAIQKYIKDQGYGLGTLVAFSGEINDPTSGPDAFTETSKVLNPGLAGRDIREAFKLPEYHILLVANKFQTGFDQPLLCGMYVDRRLAGIQAVQTLSRLNRAHPGKDTTYVLDFVNSGDDILAAFRTYYETAELDNVTDPNLVLDLKAKLDGLGYYDEFEVNRVVGAELNPSSKQSDLVAAIRGWRSLPPAFKYLLRAIDGLECSEKFRSGNLEESFLEVEAGGERTPSSAPSTHQGRLRLPRDGIPWPKGRKVRYV